MQLYITCDSSFYFNCKALFTREISFESKIKIFCGLFFLREGGTLDSELHLSEENGIIQQLYIRGDKEYIF